MQIQIVIPSKQIVETIKSLDIYTRVGCGQFRELFTEAEFISKESPDHINYIRTLYEDLKIDIFKKFGIELFQTSYLSIGNAKPIYKITYILLSCIQNIYYNANPNFGGPENVKPHNVWRRSPFIEDNFVSYMENFCIPAVYLHCVNDNVFDIELYLTGDQVKILDQAISLRGGFNLHHQIDNYIANIFHAYKFNSAEFKSNSNEFMGWRSNKIDELNKFLKDTYTKIPVKPTCQI